MAKEEIACICFLAAALQNVSVFRRLFRVQLPKLSDGLHCLIVQAKDIVFDIFSCHKHCGL
jgi:hypothetical protein